MRGKVRTLGLHKIHGPDVEVEVELDVTLSPFARLEAPGKQRQACIRGWIPQLLRTLPGSSAGRGRT